MRVAAGLTPTQALISNPSFTSPGAWWTQPTPIANCTPHKHPAQWCPCSNHGPSMHAVLQPPTPRAAQSRSREAACLFIPCGCSLMVHTCSVFYFSFSSAGVEPSGVSRGSPSTDVARNTPPTSVILIARGRRHGGRRRACAPTTLGRLALRLVRSPGVVGMDAGRLVGAQARTLSARSVRWERCWVTMTYVLLWFVRETPSPRCPLAVREFVSVGRTVERLVLVLRFVVARALATVRAIQ